MYSCLRIRRLIERRKQSSYAKDTAIIRKQASVAKYLNIFKQKSVKQSCNITYYLSSDIKFVEFGHRI